MKEMNRNFVAKITWYCESDLGEKFDYITVQAESYGLAVDKIEDYYKDILVSIDITEVEAGSVSLITKECYDSILKGEVY